MTDLEMIRRQYAPCPNGPDCELHPIADEPRRDRPMTRGIAILVRYAGPTNTRGSRWIATADHPEGRAVVGYDHELDTGIENARTAADALVARWNAGRHPEDPPWSIVAGGHTRTGYAFVAAFRLEWPA